jgi:hypothetical protein
MGDDEVGQTVTYFEAWARWANGDPSLKDAVLWGMRILWWGRIGKGLAFLSGLVLIVDIIGPERIHDFSKRSAVKVGKYFPLAIGALALATMGLVAVNMVGDSDISRLANGDGPFDEAALLIPPVTIIVAFVIFLLSGGIGNATMRVMKNPKLVAIVRLASLTSFASGFHFDMLAS